MCLHQCADAPRWPSVRSAWVCWQNSVHTGPTGPYRGEHCGFARNTHVQYECVLSGSFIRLCSGRADNGSYGVEAWFARRAGRESEAALAFLPEELTVVYWDPRLLCVKVHHCSLRFMVVVLHAPTAQDPGRTPWWQHCHEVLSRTAQGCKVLVLGDFNTRFSRSLHSRIGGFVWPSRQPVPEPLYGILRQHDLWVPATFEGCHWGPHETWFPPNGAGGFRLDYIAIPCEWVVPEHGSYVLEGLDFGQTSIDHFGVCLTVTCRSGGGAQQIMGRQKILSICREAPLFP